jgi:peptide chain release factor 2
MESTNGLKAKLFSILKIEEKKTRVAQIEKEMSQPNFWDNREKATVATQELSYLNDILKRFEQAESHEQLLALEKESLLAGKYDNKNAILSLHAGAGGTEAQDWAQMLLRMYMRFAQGKGWSYEILDQSSGEEAGIKSATMEVKGINAFGYLKSESGVHRLVRISPFDADKARHTSFAIVDVIPELDEALHTLNEKDIRVDVFKASGHGGQGVNTTDSAVRLTHLPTGIVVSVQNERSQLQNKAVAMKILASRLQSLEEAKQKDETARLRGQHLPVEWGSQIRSYVLQPYQQVKDHRTGYTSSNPNAVLNGDISVFIDAYLQQEAT